MWQTPKTSWAATDEVPLELDYERIRGNLEHLQAWPRGSPQGQS